MAINIVMGNSKLGKQIPVVNMPPIMTCRPGSPCNKYCYARKGTFLYDNVIKSHIHNLQEYWDNPEGFFNQVIDFLNNGVVSYKYFRWHSAGDVQDMGYLKGMVRTALACPQTEFLAFTKRFEFWNEFVDNGGVIPTNLHVVFSHWDKAFKVPNPHNFPCTYVDFKDSTKNDDIPPTAFKCPGSCATCQQCWKMKSGDAVFFHQH